MITTLMRTNDTLGPVLVRLALGVVIFGQGAQKALGWFGGGGWSGTIGFFTTHLGVPAFIAALVILGEFLGAIGLLTGTLTRIAAAEVAIIMVGAALMVQWSGPHGDLGEVTCTTHFAGYLPFGGVQLHDVIRMVRPGIQRVKEFCAQHLAKGSYFPGCPPAVK
jgi:uncharacterized membrane protein YphA (DoxX/SURF4 family)